MDWINPAAVHIGGTIFGLAHQQPQTLPYLIVTGVVYAYVFERTRSIFASALAHGTGKDMFDARHVPYPTNDWTYEDFRKAAKQLTGSYPVRTDSGSKLRFGYAWNQDDYRINQYMWAWGGDWLSRDLKTCTLNSKPVQEAFTWWRDLRYKDHGAPTPTQATTAGDPVGGFRDQRYAMTFAGPWALNYMVKPSEYTGLTPPAFRWGAVQTPKGPEGRVGLVSAAVEVISAKSQNKDAAWWLVRFLTEGKGGAQLGAYGIGIPGSVELAQDPAVKKTHGPLLDVFTQAMQDGRALRTLSQYDRFWDTVNKNLEPMWKDQVSVSDATARACHDVQGLLAPEQR